MVARTVAAKGKPGQESEVFRPRKKRHPVDWEATLARIPGVKTVVECGAGHHIFRQGQPADSVFYLRRGKVKTHGRLATRQGSHHLYSGVG